VVVRLEVCEQAVSRRCAFQSTRRVADGSLERLVWDLSSDQDGSISWQPTPKIEALFN
jgi:hypothetical protein